MNDHINLIVKVSCLIIYVRNCHPSSYKLLFKR